MDVILCDETANTITPMTYNYTVFVKSPSIQHNYDIKYGLSRTLYIHNMTIISCLGVTVCPFIMSSYAVKVIIYIIANKT